MKDIGVIVAGVVAFAAILYGVMEVSMESSQGSNTPNATVTGAPLPEGVEVPVNGVYGEESGAYGEDAAGDVGDVQPAN